VPAGRKLASRNVIPKVTREPPFGAAYGSTAIISRAAQIRML
jgi:hypothetical protein